jgi:hypothetical protein
MSYRNFKTALYARVEDLTRISDLHEFDKQFALLEKHIHIDKIYLESLRSFESIQREKLLLLKKYFENKGLKVSCGITTTGAEKPDGHGFNSLCYTNSEHREKLKAVVEMSATIFDEIILDDFFYTNCKCSSCIKAKGDDSWSKFRLHLMKEVADQLIIGPAKNINPDINMVIKFPNWYDSFRETGYSLETESRMFDMIYTGTETRDPMYTQQHLPKYLSYFIMRYFENVKPLRNGGGWFDSYECSGSLNTYVEQAYLTLFAKPREVTLFCLGTLLDKQFRIFTPLAGYAFEALDEFLGELGTPLGTACYIPCGSSGEDYLHNHVGMLGIPLEAYPYFPEGQSKIFLTESAAGDMDIIEKIEKSLQDGGDVIISTGLVKALHEKGLDRLATIRMPGKKALVDRFSLSKTGFNLESVFPSWKSILLPLISMHTNDACSLIEGIGACTGLSVLSVTHYGKGRLYVLTIPEDSGDLCNYPREVLNKIRSVLKCNAPVTLDAKANIALFTYDNNTFVLESFLPHADDVNIIIDRPGAVLQDLVTGTSHQGITTGSTTHFTMNLPSGTYKAFRIK